MMPRLSPTMEFGEILQWHVKTGSDVEAYNLILDVKGLGLLDSTAGAHDTDVDMEIEIMEDAKVCKILHAVGDTVKVDSPIAILSEEEDSYVLASQLTADTIPVELQQQQAMWQAYKKA